MMLRFSSQTSDFLREAGILSLRLMVGFALVWNHGWAMFHNVIRGEIDFPDPIGIGPLASQALMGFAEFVCVLCVMVGFFTHLSCLPIIIGFSVAFFVVHGPDRFIDKELSWLYLAAFCAIFLLNGGKYSVDHFLRMKKTR